MPPAHNIYAEQLSDLHRGHPLYHPEPRPEGPVEIGDVGYTKDGAFRRLFNASRPANDPIQRFGVPDDFVQLDLGVIDAYDAVLEPGPLHSRTISTLSTEIGTPGEILPAEASFRFSCSSKRGAILMLETQMMREEAVQSRRLEAYVVQNCRSWHAFARDLDIHVGFGDLMLVTECSKTAAWSSAVYSNSSTEFGLSFSVGMPFSTAGISASSSLEKIGPVERRRSQKRAQAHGAPLPKDHTVFIKAYRVGMRQLYYQSLVSLFMKARHPGVTRGEREGTSGSRNSSHAASPVESSVIGPYEPDFNPSVALLALEMEKNNNAEFVVLHDDVWCSMTPDSEGSRLMDEYTDFHFSDEVTSFLNSMLGEIPYAAELLPSDMDESLPSPYPYFGAPQNSSPGDNDYHAARRNQLSMPLSDLIPSEESVEDYTSSPRSADGPDCHAPTVAPFLTDVADSSFSESSFELISPEVSGERVTSHLTSTTRYIFPETRRAIMDTTDMSPNITFTRIRHLVYDTMQENPHDAYANFERAARKAEKRGVEMLELMSQYYRISPSSVMFGRETSLERRGHHPIATSSQLTIHRVLSNRRGVFNNTNGSWRIGLENPHTLEAEGRILARGSAIFGTILEVSDHDTTAVEVGALASELWRSMTSFERETLCRALFRTTQSNTT